MPVPTNKNELLTEIKSTYQKLRIDLESIPEALVYTKNLEGHVKGAKMSICNLVAYLIGWGELVLKWNKIREQKNEPDFPETGYKWNALGKLAQKFYVDFGNYNYNTLLKRFDRTIKNLLDLIENKTDKQLYGAPWYTKWTMGRMVQFNTSSPYKNAHNRINKWKKQQQLDKK